MQVRDVVIIGAGPAGLATAIQLQRYNIEPVLLEQNEIGGLLRNANLVENYPGFPEGISGLDLVALFEKHLEHAGVRASFERALELEYRDQVFFVQTNHRLITSKIAVIATGTKPVRIATFPITERILCTVYPILGIRNKKVAIIGAGDAAFDYALNLSRENKVTILNRSERVKCIPLLMERCMQSRNISYLHNTTVRAIADEGDRLALTCIQGDDHNESHIGADYVVVAIGREPCLDFLGSELERRFEDLIDANRLYLVGDVKNDIYRQTAICAGDGVKAAMQIHQSIEKGFP